MLDILPISSALARRLMPDQATHLNLVAYFFVLNVDSDSPTDSVCHFTITKIYEVVLKANRPPAGPQIKKE